MQILPKELNERSAEKLECERDWKHILDCRTWMIQLNLFVFSTLHTINILKKINASESSSSGDKFHFLLEASRRSNATCLQLFSKDIEACPGELAAKSVISRCLNDQGNISPSLCDAKVYCDWKILNYHWLERNGQY